jgi:hypothetical protein
MKDKIQENRMDQVTAKKSMRENTIKEEQEFAALWKVRNEELTLVEKMDKEAEFKRNFEIKQYVKNQAEKKKVQGEKEFIEE